jgi:NAD(P)-dependent dehydrogenase (short-subunit alcohol dehydrogenase family)
MSIDLSDRTAVVTGARRGIGAAIATTLAAHGASVVLCGRDARGLKEQAAHLGGRAVPGDLTDPAVRRSLLDAVGRIDILVNNAGGFLKPSTTVECAADEWADQLALNLTVPFELCRLVLPGMIERGWGRIVNIGSLVAEAPQLGNNIAYVAAKAGLVGFTRQLAAEVAAAGVTANVVNPGTIHTEHLSDYLAATDEVSKESLAQWIPVGRLGRADEIAGVVPYLVSDLGAFTTGAVININGGAIHA